MKSGIKAWERSYLPGREKGRKGGVYLPGRGGGGGGGGQKRGDIPPSLFHEVFLPLFK